MTATQAQINGGKVGQASIVYEKYITGIFSGQQLGTHLDHWGERKTSAKTDVTTKFLNLSIKNPAGPATSTQIQVSSVDRFCRLLQPAGIIKTKIDQFCGNHGIFKNEHLFAHHCRNVWNINPYKLDPEKELRRCRLLIPSIPESDWMVNWFQSNRRKILEFVFATGFNSTTNQATVASHILWSKKKNSKDFEIIEINSLIDSIVEKAVAKVRPSGSVIELGPITIQMKGSGKSSSAYHCIQFNTSLNDIRKWI
jgi:hypothetical protein